MKANMLRLYMNMPDEKFNNLKSGIDKIKYKRLLYSLCWFHSLLIERKRFKSLGWNVDYDFNDNDFGLFYSLPTNIHSYFQNLYISYNLIDTADKIV